MFSVAGAIETLAEASKCVPSMDPVVTTIVEYYTVDATMYYCENEPAAWF
jgi:hypothetical protein